MKINKYDSVGVHTNGKQRLQRKTRPTYSEPERAAVWAFPQCRPANNSLDSAKETRISTGINPSDP